MSSQAQADEVDTLQHAVDTPQTCTAEKVKQIKSLLECPMTHRETYHGNANASSDVSGQRPSRARSKLSRSKHTTRDTRQISESRITAAEKKTFATQIVNGALKSLTVAIRTHNTSNKSDFDSRHNRGHEKPRDKRDTAGLRNVALSADVAFEFLHVCLPSREGPENDQLNIGISSLISKLIALQFHDIAVKNVEVLMKRLGSFEGTCDEVCTMLSLSQKLIKLICNKPELGNSQQARLVIACRLHLVKLLVCVDIDSLKHALIYLNADSTTNPLSLITDALQKNLITAADAGKQLNNLTCSYFVLSNLQEDSERKKLASIEQGAPLVSLEYSLLAQKIQRSMWKILNQSFNVHKDIVKPLLKCLKNYQRQSLGKRSAGIENVAALIDSQVEFCREQASHLDRDSKLQFMSAVSELELLTAAFRTGTDQKTESFDQAQSNDEIVNNWNEEGQSLCNECLLILRVDQREGVKKSTCFRKLSKLIRHVPDVKSRSWDEVLLSMSTLRRLICENLRQRDGSPNGNLDQAKEIYCDDFASIITAVPHFCLLFLVDSESVIADSRGDRTRSRRIQMVTRIARPTIDAVIFLSKTSFQKNKKNWDMISNALTSCIALLKNLQLASDQHSLVKLDQRLCGIHSALSDSLTATYLKFQNVGEVGDKAIPLLQQAVDILENAPAEEQSRSNFFGKIEKLVSIFMRTGKPGLAQRYLETALQLLGSEDILEIITSAGGPLFFHMNGHSHTNEASRFIRMARLQFTLSFILDDLSVCFSNNLRSEALQSRYHFLLSTCYLMEASRMVKEGHQESTKIVHFSLSFLESNLSPSDPGLSQIQYACIVLPMATKTGLEVQQDTRDLISKALINKENIPITLSEHQAALLRACCQIALTFVEPKPDWKRIQYFLAPYNEPPKTNDRIDSWGNCFIHLLYSDQLESLISILDHQGLILDKIKCLDLLVSFYRRQSASCTSALNAALLCLADDFINHGFMDNGGMAVQFLRQKIVDHDESLLWKGMFSAVIAKYYIAKGVFKEALLYCKNGTGFLESAEKSLSSSLNYGKCSHNDLIWVHCYLHEAWAELMSLQGLTSETLLYARAGAKCVCRLWKLIDRTSQPQEGNHNGLQANCDSLETEDRKNQSCRRNESSRRQVPSTISQYMAPLIIRCLFKLSVYLADLGQAHESRYYLSQAEGIAVISDSPYWQRKIGVEMFRVARLEGTSSSKIIEKLKEDVFINSTELDIISVLAKLELCSLYLDTQDWESFDEEAQNASQMLWEISLKRNKITKFQGEISLEQRLKISKLEDGVESTMRLSEISENTIEGLMCFGSHDRGLKYLYIIDHNSNTAIAQLQVRILLSYASMYIMQRDVDVAQRIFMRIQSLNPRKELASLNCLLDARINLQRALEKFDNSPVFNIVCEAPIAFPCKIRVDNTKSHRPGRSKDTARNYQETSSAVPNFPFEHLNYSLKAFSEIFRQGRQDLTTFQLHEISDELVKVIMLMSTVEYSSLENFQACSAVTALESGRDIAWERATVSATIERELHRKSLNRSISVPGSALYSMPLIAARVLPCSSDEYCIENLPSNWTVMSLSISENRSTFRISRLRRGQCPLVLSIPLSRHTDNSNESCFTFEQGKAELSDIVSQANASTHTIGADVKRGAKSLWWKRRKSLDQRLKDLLASIEDVWLGGFRGIFCPKRPDPTAFSHFTLRFQEILRRHLPSRRKRTKKDQNSRILLDNQILELFVGLGHPGEDGVLDDSLLDLLSFVVDILQFNGERNAYDEIDFDAMILDTTEALRTYFSTEDLDNNRGETIHTILVLDKHLHGFPWETLSCLAGLSISRLPSLKALRDHLSAESIDIEQDERKFTISAQDGAYVLNPDGDLVNTEKHFENRLASLSGSWTRIVRQTPSEKELAELLSTKALFLYFGHGSGGQYIRARTIKRLDRCAVSFLMGCSSVALSEAGSFESSGTPLTYLQAGTKAIVGTLWDVTDKDIDRFSSKLLENWGLLQGSETDVMSDDRMSDDQLSSIRNKSGEDGGVSFEGQIDCSQGVSLDSALSNARDACVMRYLNGAAPVLYGVPVFLK